jgi:hypothetical protein
VGNEPEEQRADLAANHAASRAAVTRTGRRTSPCTAAAAREPERATSSKLADGESGAPSVRAMSQRRERGGRARNTDSLISRPLYAKRGKERVSPAAASAQRSPASGPHPRPDGRRP